MHGTMNIKKTAVHPVPIGLQKFGHMLEVSYNKQPDASISQIYFGMKIYMFRTVSLSIIRSFSL
jgi:hypothetical protein